ncbi:MAG: right-handed parallel beta-helix repeat-containing protein, partial [Gemmataceae bacterium]|nr:right-handed parallel beta-helix repeat-containing protein [Gemmataceae bacterium]
GAGKGTVDNGTVSFNNVMGVWINGTSDVLIANSQDTANLQDGIVITASASNVSIQNAKISSHPGIGLSIEGGTGHSLQDNIVTLNTQKDMKIQGGTTTMYGVANLAGTVEQTGGDLNIYFDAVASKFTVTSDYKLAGGKLILNGILDIQNSTGPGDLVQTAGEFRNQFAELTVAHDYQVDGGSAYVNSSQNHISGKLLLNGGLFQLFSDLTALAGVHIGTGGYLEGYWDTITGNVFNSGVISLGKASEVGAGELLYIEGNFTQTSTGRLIMGLSDVAQDMLTVSGTATLAGTFQLVLAPGFDPAPGSEFIFLMSNEMIGAFASIEPPSGWAAIYDPVFGGGDFFGLKRL